jgi:lauroyl/myristoyl acyltransferase
MARRRSVLLKVLRGGHMVGLVCDRDLEGTGVEVDFFGERTRLARKSLLPKS